MRYLLLLFVFALAACATQRLPPMQVRTTLGIAEGVTTAEGTTAYRGIEYARAGRWQLPAEAPAWTGVKHFDAFGPACPQAGQAELIEDCLFLNVYTPANAAAGSALPVLVWIHGGGFRAGRGGADSMGFSQRGVIVVTFNYRLGALGFHDWPGWSESDPRNFGQADMVAALAWVKANAARFGGDPDNITIAGHSAGGMGVQLMMADARARGLFQRAIADAGYATWTLPRAANPSDEMRQYMRYVALETNVSAAEWIEREPGFHLPIVGGSDLPRAPIDVFRRGEQAPLPYLSGGNSYDGYGLLQAAGWTTQSFLAPYRDDPRLRAAYAGDFAVSDDQAAARMFGDMRYVFAAWATTRAMSTVKQPGYLFYFNRASEGLPGAAHGDHYSDLSDPAAAALISYFHAFITTGTPQVEGLPGWQPYDDATQAWMVVGQGAQPASGVLTGRMQMLQSVAFPPSSPDAAK